MKRSLYLLLLCFAAATHSASGDGAFCVVSNRVVTIVDVDPSTQCLSRMDERDSFIQKGGHMASPFVMGQLVPVNATSLQIAFFTDDMCSVAAGSISCIFLPDTMCVIDETGKPVLINVAMPAQCVRRDDTRTNIVLNSTQISSVTPYPVALGDAINQDFCPIQVNLFKDQACTRYIATQEISCPCGTPVRPTSQQNQCIIIEG